MGYGSGSEPARLLRGDPEIVGAVSRWIAETITSPRFWQLRSEWQDLHQEVMTRAIQSLREERFLAEKDLRLYVQGIAKHTANQRLQDLARMRTSMVADEGIGIPEAENRTILRQLVRKVLDTASEECRELYRMYFLEQSSYAEISRTMDLPVGTVKSRLFRCLRHAQRILTRTNRPGRRSEAR